MVDSDAISSRIKKSWRLDIERVTRFYTLAETVGEWALDTFGGSERIVPCAIHIHRETQELLGAAYSYRAGYATKEALAEECADLVILAMGMSAHAGFDLEAAFRKKMLENLDRKWNPPDHEGVIEHAR